MRQRETSGHHYQFGQTKGLRKAKALCWKTVNKDNHDWKNWVRTHHLLQQMWKRKSLAQQFAFLLGFPGPIPTWLGGIHSHTISSNSQTAAGSLRIQFHSDTTYSETASDPTGQAFSPTRLPPSPSSDASHKAQVITCAPDQPATDQSFQ